MGEAVNVMGACTPGRVVAVVVSGGASSVITKVDAVLLALPSRLGITSTTKST